MMLGRYCLESFLIKSAKIHITCLVPQPRILCVAGDFNVRNLLNAPTKQKFHFCEKLFLKGNRYLIVEKNGRGKIRVRCAAISANFVPFNKSDRS